MNKIIVLPSVIILSLGLSLWSSLSFSISQDDPGLKHKLEKIVENSGIQKDHLSLYAMTSSGDEVFSINGKKHLIPASITKLITTAVVLDTFKPDHQFKTQILATGNFSDGMLKGNLYLKGGGDPGFVSEKMWMLVNDFLRADIKKIDGDIVVDESYLDEEKFDKGRESDRNDRAYDAPLSGLSFNWNSTTLFVRPGAAVGDPARVYVDPANEYIILKNRAVTGKKGSDLSCEREFVNGHDVVTVSGKIGLGSDEKHIYKNVTEPSLYAGYNLKGFLKQRGVDFNGRVIQGKVPSSAVLKSEVSSERLAHLVASQNKFSNNFVAETLAKDMAAEISGGPGKMDTALQKARSFLKNQVGLDDFTLVNVSGFTRKNSFSAQQFTQLLRWVQKDFAIAPEFIQSLPVAGVDGTLEKRFKGSIGERKVRAKTGLLNGVVALSGFAGRGAGEQILFAFIFNGNGDEAHIREVFDNLAAQLTR